MSCSHGEQCICDLVKRIAQAQDKTILEQQIRDSENPFQTKLICPTRVNTIPFMLVCKGTCDFFIGKGVFKDPKSLFFECFKTPFFRVNKFTDHHGCCVHLELLQGLTKDCTLPHSSRDDDITDFLCNRKISEFIRTGICITVDLSCFCGIECLPPVLAESKLPIPVSPCEKKENKCEDREKIFTEELCGNFRAGTVTVWQAASPNDILEGTFHIFNDNTSQADVTATITAHNNVNFPPVPPGFTVTREAIEPVSFTITAPPNTSGRYCITLVRSISIRC
ncbi:Spore coat protein Z [Schinkia azotoformans MEV2011]|uniref:Spore coat protein Z n=1 Tax=Schinkia azotoformans MEV2011 TaxID=1348973 RepID=A0A072NL03_SCHAZ|nr:CotY/CotZ family spore coat protein [Schinkia azotoformans]KEF38369.1 Spore coat protein Z [Schinkia azotoformans MEV2011]MEC1694112.1 CotY/CotZ family spore coat protein [Schinkia azotoformans]MEC1715824.1 CotY/CotZ family spore coat protein [Schinkia azotoformans]MEC1724883.1 CotY/CotZ family spore coat protein [Schinkia azotoformans]MEC1741463.1 CotY/CotZ family spore coat protein [Schinkia azotoformans]